MDSFAQDFAMPTKAKAFNLPFRKMKVNTGSIPRTISVMKQKEGLTV